MLSLEIRELLAVAVLQRILAMGISQVNGGQPLGLRCKQELFVLWSKLFSAAMAQLYLWLISCLAFSCKFGLLAGCSPLELQFY